MERREATYCEVEGMNIGLTVVKNYETMDNEIF